MIFNQNIQKQLRSTVTWAIFFTFVIEFESFMFNSSSELLFCCCTRVVIKFSEENLRFFDNWFASNCLQHNCRVVSFLSEPNQSESKYWKQNKKLKQNRTNKEENWELRTELKSKQRKKNSENWPRKWNTTEQTNKRTEHWNKTIN